jgi:hypothetical protein
MMGQLPASEDTRIREFIQVLTNEIDATKRDGGSGSMVFDRQFVRQDGPCFVYAFSTESILLPIFPRQNTGSGAKMSLTAMNRYL